MIKLNCFLIAQYAATAADGSLTIAGTFDNLDVKKAPDAPAEAVAAVPLGRAYLAAVSQASLEDGLSHRFRLRVMNGNGVPIMNDTFVSVAYRLNAFGRPMRHHLVLQLKGLILPGPDDYVFELSAENQGVLGELVLSVTDRSGETDA